MIIISPAKNLNILPEKLPIQLSEPFFINDTNSLASKLKKLQFDKLKKLMNISDSLTELNLQRFQDFNSNKNVFKPAVFLFSGDTFNGLSIRSFSKEMLSLAQERLRILSGLYGLLRPLDIIQPYRLEMGTQIKIGKHNDLYDFWGDEITKAINEDKNSDYLINLASVEYFKSINKEKLNSKLINIIFKEKRNGDYKIIGINAKKARGLMSRFIIKNKISNPKELKKFKAENYSYNKNLSSDSDWIFTR